jgi:hypothetical protein
MPAVAQSLDEPDEGGEAFEAELSRLELEIKQVNRQLDRLEGELHNTLSDLARERFEGYR